MTFFTTTTTATITPVQAPLIYDLDDGDHLLMGLRASALVFLRSPLNTAAKVILLNCTSDLSLFSQSSSLAAVHLTQSESQRPHSGSWGPLFPHLSLTCLLHSCQLRACAHAVHPDISAPPSPPSSRFLFRCYLRWDVCPDDLVLCSTHLLTPTLPLPLLPSVFPYSPSIQDTCMYFYICAYKHTFCWFFIVHFAVICDLLGFLSFH